MRITPQYTCSETYRGQPGQATEIVSMIAAHADESSCLEWPYKRKATGLPYGIVRHDGTDWRVHRLAYKIVHGDIPDGKIIMHSCDNPPCFNPNHLSPGTRTENAADRHQKGRTKKAVSPVRGEAQWKSKLTDSDIIEIRESYRNGHSQTAVAIHFSISQVCVSRIVLGRSWKHVPM